MQKKKYTLFLKLNTSPIKMKENNLYNNIKKISSKKKKKNNKNNNKKRTSSNKQTKFDYMHFHLLRFNCL